MINVINIKEEKNRLSLVDTYTPVVAGNSTYYLSFTFSEEWQKCNKKTAIFMVEGKKIVVEFEGTDCKVPVLPNISCFYVALVSAENENEQLSTTGIRIRVEPTFAHEEIGELDPLKGYLANIMGAMNKIENGDLSVKMAERALNVSNHNLLINGNFQVNQRGLDTYSLSGNNYTFDRWLGFNGLVVSKTDNGVMIDNSVGLSNGMFQQKLENKFSEFAGKMVTISAKVNGSLVFAAAQIPTSKPAVQTDFISKSLGILGAGTSETYLRFTLLASGVLSFNFYIPTCSSFELEWAKLEIGAYPTTFVPRVYAEELALCKRYYYKHKASQNYGNMAILFSSWTAANFYGFLSLHTELRTYPTVLLSGSLRIAFNNKTEAVVKVARSAYDKQTVGLVFSVETGESWVGGLLQSNNDMNAFIECDAEIY